MTGSLAAPPWTAIPERILHGRPLNTQGDEGVPDRDFSIGFELPSGVCAEQKFTLSGLSGCSAMAAAETFDNVGETWFGRMLFIVDMINNMMIQTRHYGKVNLLYCTVIIQ
jgi:hypothetical protein